MLLVVERRQSRRLPGAVRSERQRAIKQRKNASAPSSSARRARDSRRSQLAETDGAHFERSLPCPTSKVAR